MLVGCVPVRRVATLLAVAMVVAATTLTGARAAHATYLPPQNPPKSLPPSQAFLAACDNVSNDSPTCIAAALTQIDADRAAEGVGPMTLPTNFTSLTTPEQIYVVANLERVDRGEAPIEGLSNALDSYAQAGANAGTDPSFPPWAAGAGSTWSGGSNIFVADQGWMYDDGPGGFNLDCTQTNHTGCWGHRDIMLAAWPSPALMGAGQTTSGVYGGSVTELYLGDDTHDTADFTWADVTSHLPLALSASALDLRAAPGASSSGTLRVSESGLGVDVTFALAQSGTPFSLSSSGCDLVANSSCTVRVTYRPSSVGATANTLMVTTPSTTDQVALTGTSGGAWVTDSDGKVIGLAVTGYGPHVGRTPATPVVGIAPAPSGQGYWLVTRAGRVFHYGDAGFFGPKANRTAVGDVVGIAATRSGRGYWVATASGRVFHFGDAQSFSGPALTHVVGIAADPATHGYWLVTSAGRVAGYGAPSFGPRDGRAVGAPIGGIAPTPDGGGYWLVTQGGRVDTFGDAHPYGSVSAVIIGALTIVGIAATPDGHGYWLLGSDGVVASLGDAKDFTGATESYIGGLPAAIAAWPSTSTP